MNKEETDIHRLGTRLKTLVDTVVSGAQWLSLELPRPHPASNARNGKHLALVAFALPPSTNAGVYRPLSFMRYGSQLGWRVDAFCGEPPHNESQHGHELLSLVPPEATLHVVPASTRHPSYRFFSRVDGGFTNAIAYARHAIATLANDPPDVVLASGPPFFSFVTAFFIARRFRVPLVLDYRDEWTQCPFDFVSKDGNDVTWERRCLSAARVVLFTTESHRRQQLKAFPTLDERKTHVVPNGWEPQDFAEPDGVPTVPPAGSDRRLRLSHVGNLSGHSSPLDFLETLEQLLLQNPEWESLLTVQLIGRRSVTSDAAIQSFRFPSVLEVVDHVGKREASRRMQESDALLLIANPALERYLPGKLFDYLAARRPVLVFGSRGESSDLIERLHAGLLCPAGSARAFEDALIRLRDFDSALDKEAVTRWLEEHRRDRLATRAFGIIDSVIDERATAGE
ncbi:MAG: glycosyltransferase [Gemmatimonadota bacterium]